MPKTKLDNVVLYRIVHLDNVEYILRNGMCTPNHPLADPAYINIGDSSLIERRKDYPVKIDPPNGTLGEYIPFYFGPLSPMLLNIKTGYSGVVKRPQSDIVYLCCSLNDVIANCSAWCFTDGHAKNSFSVFFNDLKDLTEVDWNLVAKKYWNNNEEDIDRMRRKQAEFLVKDYLPVNCISKIIVFDEKKANFVSTIIDLLGLNIPVFVNPQGQFYYS
jgi:hypothetical protein